MLDGFLDSRLRRVLFWSFAVAVATFLIAPSLIVVPMSFSDADFLEFPPRTLSLRWYEEYFTSVTWMRATRASAIVAVATVSVSVPVGTIAAYATRDLTARPRLVVGGYLLLPAVIPAILVAIGLFFLLAKLGLVGSLSGLVLCHTALAIPVVYVFMGATFAQFDANQERAAESLGANVAQRWLWVVLPQIRGSLVAAALLAFVTSLDEVVVAMFVTSGETATLPKVMFVSLRDKIDPTVAVVSSLLLAIAAASVAVMLRDRKGAPVG